MKKRYFRFHRCFPLLFFAFAAFYGNGSIYAAPETQAPSSSGVQLTAQFEANVLHVGDRLLLKVIARNTSDHVAYFNETAPEVDEFEITVKDSTGHVTPLTLWGAAHKVHELHGHGQFELMHVPLAIFPGKDVTFQFILNRQFDMSLGGGYSVVVARSDLHIKDSKSTFRLVSNRAAVLLIEPEPEVVSPERVFFR